MKQFCGRCLVLPFRAAWVAVRLTTRVVRRLQFAECGGHVRFDPFGSYTPMSAMHFGSHVFLGPGARITAHEGFFIGDHSGAGPGLLVIGGNRNIEAVGHFMLDITTGGENLPVRVEDDVYMGARVTLLKGVVVGQGSVVGACSVVTKSLPPYTIAAGTPCRPLRPRFSLDELRRHLDAVPVTRYSFDEVVAAWDKAGIIESAGRPR